MTKKLLLRRGENRAKEGAHPPSVDDYVAFHGMFCSPSVRQCIGSFDGSAFFADKKKYYESSSGCNLEFIDYGRRRFFRLQVFTYYPVAPSALQVSCSLFGQTKLPRKEKKRNILQSRTNEKFGTDIHEDLQVLRTRHCSHSKRPKRQHSFETAF
jgi:hypothetical protein